MLIDYQEDPLPQLDYVVGVSWPRSGFHMMQRMLQEYFDKRMLFCLDYMSMFVRETKGAC